MSPAKILIAASVRPAKACSHYNENITSKTLKVKCDNDYHMIMIYMLIFDPSFK